MPHVICEPCSGVKDRSCQEVCPVECIYDAGEQLYIHPDECIDCGAWCGGGGCFSPGRGRWTSRAEGSSWRTGMFFPTATSSWPPEASRAI